MRVREEDVYLTRREFVKEYNNFIKIRMGINESIERILRKNPLSNEDKNRLVDLVAKKRDAEDKLKRLREMFEGFTSNKYNKEVI